MRSESLVLANVQYEISEKNFANGTIESSDLAVDKESDGAALGQGGFADDERKPRKIL